MSTLVEKNLNENHLSNKEKINALKINGRVGFDTLPDQLVAKAIHHGFAFNILCVGEIGIGKSTLMETLFRQKLDLPCSDHDSNKETELKAHTQELKEKNVKLRLTVVESVGYAGQVNREGCSKVIEDYLDTQFESYLQEELRIKRDLKNYHDTRIHVCLYFISPTGHSLKSYDLVTMQRLQSKVNLIPIIAKSDIITKPELNEFKQKIIRELKENNINYYTFPTDDEQVREINESMNAFYPFAIVSSTEEVKSASSCTGKPIRGRQYPWGVVQVENAAHCDFVKLREMLLRVNMEDLRESTQTRHYEAYRRRRLLEMGFVLAPANGSGSQSGGDNNAEEEAYDALRAENGVGGGGGAAATATSTFSGTDLEDVANNSPQNSLRQVYERRRRAQLQAQQRREEEMRQLFVMKVKEKEEELKEAERKLNQQFEAAKRQHAEDRKRFEERKRLFEEDLSQFERRRQSVTGNDASSKFPGITTLRKTKKN